MTNLVLIVFIAAVIHGLLRILSDEEADRPLDAPRAVLGRNEDVRNQIDFFDSFLDHFAGEVLESVIHAGVGAQETSSRFDGNPAP